MKIFYNRKEIITEVKNIISSDGFSAGFVFKEDSERIIEKLEKYDFPPARAPMGGVPPEGWIDFGKHVISFIISEDIAKGILSAAIWETIKKVFTYLKKNKKDNNDTVSIVTDEYESSKFQKSIYFVFYAYQSEEEIARGVEQIAEVRQRLFNFLEIADIKKDSLRLTYYNNRWSIN